MVKMQSNCSQIEIQWSHNNCIRGLIRLCAEQSPGLMIFIRNAWRKTRRSCH